MHCMSPVKWLSYEMCDRRVRVAATRIGQNILIQILGLAFIRYSRKVPVSQIGLGLIMHIRLSQSLYRAPLLFSILYHIQALSVSPKNNTDAQM